MATQLPKFRGFRSTGIQQPTTSTSGGYGSVPENNITIPTVEPKKKKDGFFTSLAKGIVKPAVDYTKFVGEAALQGGRALLDPQMRKATFNPGAMTEEDWIKLGDKKKTFLVDEKDIKDRGTIAKTGLKRTAGAATYAIPGSVGAKGVMGVARAGALSGGLYGLYEGDDIDPGRIFTNAATGAVAAPAMYLGGQAVSKIGNKVTGKFGGAREKLGQKLLDEADDYAVKSTRINTSRQNKFKKSTGKTIGEFVQEKGLYGQDMDAVQAMIDPLQKARSEAIKGGNKMVNPMQVIDDFNVQIAELTQGANALDPSNLKRATALKQARDQFSDEAVRYAQEIGDNSISQYPLEFIDKARASIDANTPKSQFMVDPQGAGNQRAIGSVYRDRVNTTAGTKQTGLDLRDLYQYRDALEVAPKGNNTLPFGLNKGLYGTMGGVATKLPFGVGEAIGMAGESIINNPKNIGRISKGMRAAGTALQNGTMPAMPNVANKIPGNMVRNAGINSVNAGVNNLSERSPEAQASRQEVVLALSQQGIVDPQQISQMINEAAQRQGMTPDFTPEEVQQYIGGTGNQPTQMPKFRGFRQ